MRREQQCFDKLCLDTIQLYNHISIQIIQIIHENRIDYKFRNSELKFLLNECHCEKTNK